MLSSASMSCMKIFIFKAAVSRLLAMLMAERQPLLLFGYAACPSIWSRILLVYAEWEQLTDGHFA